MVGDVVDLIGNLLDLFANPLKRFPDIRHVILYPLEFGPLGRGLIKWRTRLSGLHSDCRGLLLENKSWVTK